MSGVVPSSGLGFQVKVLKMFEVVPSSNWSQSVWTTQPGEPGFLSSSTSILGDI